jgi:hypothetical protein
LNKPTEALKKKNLKKEERAGCLQLTPIIPATQEAEIRESWFKVSLSK